MFNSALQRGMPNDWSTNCMLTSHIWAKQVEVESWEIDELFEHKLKELWDSSKYGCEYCVGNLSVTWDSLSIEKNCNLCMLLQETMKKLQNEVLGHNEREINLQYIVEMQAMEII